MVKFKESLLEYTALIVLFGLFCWLHFDRLTADLWNDELYSIKEFVLAPIGKTLTDYHSPNNHIFFNFINNLYLKVIGIHDLSTLIEHPVILRIISAIYGFFTWVFLYKIGKSVQGKWLGFTAIIILATTLPYWTFVFQLRGYGLSMLLITMLSYFALSYLNEPKYKHLPFVSVCTLLLFYTTVITLYSICGILTGLGILFIFTLSKKKSSKPFLFLLFAIFVGLFAGLLLYSPVFSRVFANEFVHAGIPFQFDHLFNIGRALLHDVLSNRWALFVLIFAGIIFAKGFLRKNGKILLVMMCTAITPLLIVFVRGDATPMRTFSVLLPIISMLIAMSILPIQKILNSRFQWIFPIILSTYCLFISSQENQNVKIKLLRDLSQGIRSQNLYYQYYSAHYQPLEDLKRFNERWNDNHTPLVLVGCEPFGAPYFLEQQNIQFLKEDSLSNYYKANDRIFILTNFPNKLEVPTGWSMEVLNEPLTYHNFILLTRNR